MINIIIFPIIYAFFLIILTYFSKKLDFIDKPNFRKLHSNKIVNTCGITTYFFMIFIVITNEYSYEVENIIVLGSIVILTGF